MGNKINARQTHSYTIDQEENGEKKEFFVLFLMSYSCK